MRNVNKLLLVLLLPLAVLGARSRPIEPTIHPVLIATPVQQPCGVPCAVHLDMTGTTVAAASFRPFHDLRFEYICGGDFKAPADPISVCRFDTPGIKVIGARIERPDTGEFVFTTAHVLVTTTSNVLNYQAGGTYPAPSFTNGGGLLQTVGEGPPARFTGTLAPRSNWTISNIEAMDGIEPATGSAGVSVFDSDVSDPDIGTFVTPYGSTVSNDLLALIGNNLTGQHGRVLFLRQARAIIVDNFIDGGSPPGIIANGYNLRTTHFPKSIISRNIIQGPGSEDNNIQLRSGQASLVPTADNRYIVISENKLNSYYPRSSAIRGCQGSTCTDSNVPSSVDLVDVLIRDNVAEIINTVSISAFAWMQGGDITVRDNWVVASAAGFQTSTPIFFAHVGDSTRPKSTGGEYNHDRVYVYDNTFLGDGRSVHWLDSPVGSGHFVSGNVAE